MSNVTKVAEFLDKAKVFCFLTIDSDFDQSEEIKPGSIIRVID